jgi:hypothetical protein
LILNEIQTKLKELDEHVFYGMVDNSMQKTLWNYIVFNRTTMKASQNKTGYTDYYTVHIIREEWIPEGFEIDVINKMLEINGMRLAGNDAVYSYVPKPNTNIVVEMLSIDFMKAKKA